MTIELKFEQTKNGAIDPHSKWSTFGVNEADAREQALNGYRNQHQTADVDFQSLDEAIEYDDECCAASTTYAVIEDQPPRKVAIIVETESGITDNIVDNSWGYDNIARDDDEADDIKALLLSAIEGSDHPFAEGDIVKVVDVTDTANTPASNIGGLIEAEAADEAAGRLQAAGRVVTAGLASKTADAFVDALNFPEPHGNRFPVFLGKRKVADVRFENEQWFTDQLSENQIDGDGYVSVNRESDCPLTGISIAGVQDAIRAFLCDNPIQYVITAY